MVTTTDAVEARDWLRRGYTSAKQVDDLMGRIAKHRGQAAADKLREEMRRQWRYRAEWLEAPEIATPDNVCL